MCAVTKAEELCIKLQQTWEHDQRLFFRNLRDTAPVEATKRNCQKVLNYMSDGLHNYGRHYHVKIVDGVIQVRYTCEVSGKPAIHCVINKETGDVAKYSTDLINESCFQFNIIDPRSRFDLFSVAHHTGDYLS